MSKIIFIEKFSPVRRIEVWTPGLLIQRFPYLIKQCQLYKKYKKIFESCFNATKVISVITTCDPPLTHLIMFLKFQSNFNRIPKTFQLFSFISGGR
jgi:hypothetical protein